MDPASRRASAPDPAGGGDARGPCPPVLVLTGPTATGKSELGLTLAAALGGEIVSADSAMVYRGLDIGSAKPTPAERDAVPHHLIDIRDPAQPFSVAEYVPLAEDAVRDVGARGRVPLLVGGTGLYVRQLLQAPDLPPVPPQPEVRAALERRARDEGPGVLHAELAALDPVAAAAIHPANVRRVIRALEVARSTGRPISSFWGRERRPRLRALVLVCDRPRDVLAGRIRARVRAMLAAGLVDEVRGLLAAGVPAAAQSLQALGYKETVAWLAAREPPVRLEEAIVGATARYAKRQRTWWRADTAARWVDLGRGPAAAVAERVAAWWREVAPKPPA